tara:strand:+ start:457 stop:1371 length:915 start_codon:yes stop_codon:yes gene_type:complete
MKAQFDNRVMSSFLLWFDHTLLREGEAFTDASSWFYPVESLHNNLYTYGAPFKQFVSDFSITGTGAAFANTTVQIPTGIYLDGSLIGTGTNNFSGINYEQGQVYFGTQITTPETRLSGDYAIKDFNVYLTNEPEEKLLFETKFSLRPKTAETQTGLASNAITYPAIFLRYNGSHSEPLAFGGYDMTTINLRAVVLADNQFNLDAVCSIMRDKVRTFFTLFGTGDMPYNTLGDYKNGVPWSYTGKKASYEENSYIFIENVGISKFSRDVNVKVNNLNPDVFNGVIDFEVTKPRYPRKANRNQDLQ